MKKKLLIVFIALFFIGVLGIIYLNNVILPIKIKSLIVTALAEQTQKKVSLQSLQFSIFKGLVLRNLVISDDKGTIISLKEASCAFLIPPIFKRKIIIPTLSLKSPKVCLERRPDSTFNLRDLLVNSNAQPKPLRFSVFVYKINLTDASLHFKDETLTPVFSKDIKNLNAILYLSLPSSVKFKLKSQIPGNPLTDISAAGEFKLPGQQLLLKAAILNLSPKEFFPYYQNLGIEISEGLINCLIDLEFKENVLNVNLSAQNKNLNIAKDNIKAVFNSDLKANLRYNARNTQLKFSGKATIADAGILGLDFLGPVKGIKGEVAFSNSGILSDKLSAEVLGVAIQTKFNLGDFTNPLLKVEITSRLTLEPLKKILKDKFQFAFPGDIQGEANLFLNLQTQLPFREPPEVNGHLDILNARLKLEKISSPVEDISGRIEFSTGQLKWSKLNFQYLGIPYTSVGALTNFRAPEVNLSLSSKELSLETVFAVNNNLIRLDNLSGKYLNSDFKLGGIISTGALPKIQIDTGLTGVLNLNLEDIKELSKKFSAAGREDRLEQMKLSGLVKAQFSLSGNVNEIKSCAIIAKLSSPHISAYGFKAQGCALEYNQADGIIDIPVIHLSLYDGAINAAAKMNFSSENLPYWLKADIQGLRLEKLKLDTTAKEKDIAGSVNAQVKVNGFSNDLAKLSGAGAVNISEGKLWQLNLFKGLGSLLFARDFANIVFNEGSCNFTVRDKYIFSDDVKLKSNIANLTGKARIGFDSSIDTALDVEILDEAAPLRGTLKDITTTIVGQGKRFGVIRITGTLKEPKYKFQPAVLDIISGLKNVIFGE